MIEKMDVDLRTEEQNPTTAKTPTQWIGLVSSQKFNGEYDECIESDEPRESAKEMQQNITELVKQLEDQV
jgi:hypothetical protein